MTLKGLEMLQAKSRYLISYGGAGSSKSYSLAQKHVIRCLLHPFHKFVGARKFNTTVRASVFEQIKGIIKEWGISDLVKVNIQLMRFDFFSGSQIYCTGLDDPEKIKSIPYITGWWLEEASELTLHDFLQCDLRMRSNVKDYQQIALSFNPVAKSNWVYKEFFEKDKDDCIKIKSTYQDNRFLPETYISVLEKMINSDEQYYNVYCKGDWGTLDGLVYYNFNRDIHLIKPCIDIGRHSEIFIGMDFNVNPMSALVFVEEAGKSYCIDTITLKNSNTHEMAKEIINRYPQFNIENVHVYPDASGGSRKTSADIGVTDISILLSYGFDVCRPFKNPPVKDRINSVNFRLKDIDGNPQMFIEASPQNEELIRCFEGLNYKDGSNQVDKSTGLDHLLDACGYYIHYKHPAFNIKEAFNYNEPQVVGLI
jgi:PBSX family phage terminase large subunit